MADAALGRVAVLSPVAVLALFAISSVGRTQSAPSPDITPKPSQTIEVTVTLPGGVDFSGRVVDDDAHGLVLWDGKAPYVFAWCEMTPGAEYRVKLALLGMRKGDAGVSAEDHFELGAMLLSRAEPELAVQCFRKAQQLDRSYETRWRALMEEHSHRPRDETALDFSSKAETNETGEPQPGLKTQELLSGLPPASLDDLRIAPVPPDQTRSIADQIKGFFSPKLRESINKDIDLVETDHFLIWTDLPRAMRQPLARAAEDMYAALCRQFGYDAEGNIFLGKCPVFCLRSRGEFFRFARSFDDYRESTAIGYTRSVQERGYVHVVLFYQGRSPQEWQRFVGTLVHEGSHAFLHRFRTSRLIPVWLNEGYAELMTERVLQDQCPAAENAALLARQFVKFDWPVRNLMRGTGPIEVHQYPIAHSLVAWLEAGDPAKFAVFMAALKDGSGVEEALKASFEGMTLDDWEARWRQAIKAGFPQAP
ncbi:MAG: hypothetical protein IT449_14585 [Phycisphaerales bacterium]|nr:hypothetical protein [Phycisphaerales bacterium]